MTTSRSPRLLLHEGIATQGSFQQQRVQLFLKMLVSFFGVFLVIAAIKYVTLRQSGMHEWLDPVRDAALVFALITAALAGVWLFVRAGVRSPRALLLVESVGTVLACSGLAAMVPFIPVGTNEIAAGFMLVLALVIRAALVPSTGRRTLAVGLFSTAPLATVLLVRGMEADLDTEPMVYFAGLVVATWGAIFAAATMVISRVIYGLHEELRDLGSYRLVERLGHGGMGEVWRAEHRMLARRAAIKMIRANALAGSGDTASALGRFEQEAQATAALTCPNTIHLYDFGHSNGTCYYVMELLDGLDLETLVNKHGPQPAARVRHILMQICRSLHEAHTAGLIHRDVKPANVFLCRYGAELDFVKVLDFGLVKHHAEPIDTGLTRDGVAIGTPAFMAPEMIMGDVAVDGRADLYAVGCVGYWLLAGALVFEAETPTALLVKHAKEEPQPPSSRTELEIPQELERIVMACLQKDRSDRPASAHDLREELAAIRLDWSEADAESWWQLHLPRPEPPV